MSQQEIIDYYDECEADYRHFWDLNTSHAMHAGFWDHTTQTLRDALRRENEVLAEMVGVDANTRVLDAGCGVGGSAVYLAKKFGCHVDGISLSQQQIQKAKALAEKRGVASLANFHCMDYTQTNFQNGSFDVIWAIESVCHAPDKAHFFNEAYRLLKPGGRLVIADGFATNKKLSEKEEVQMSHWLSGWGGNDLMHPQEGEKLARQAGFAQSLFFDKTESVWPSSRRLFWISMPAFIGSKFGEWINWRTKKQTQNIKAAFFQFVTLYKGAWCYGILQLRKGVGEVVDDI